MGKCIVLIFLVAGLIASSGYSQRITGEIVTKDGNRYFQLQNGDQETSSSLLTVIGGFSYFIFDSVVCELGLFLVSTDHSGNQSFIIGFSKTVFPDYDLHKGYRSEMASVKSDDLKGFKQKHLPQIKNGCLIVQTDNGEQSTPIRTDSFDFEKAIYRLFNSSK